MVKYCYMSHPAHSAEYLQHDQQKQYAALIVFIERLFLHQDLSKNASCTYAVSPRITSKVIMNYIQILFKH